MLTFKKTVLGEEIHYGPCVFLHIFAGYSKNWKPQPLLPGRFLRVEFVLSNPEGCGNTYSKEQDCFRSLSKQ